MLQAYQGVGICESVPMGVSRGTVPGPLALQPLPDLLVASATGRASGSACRARHALRQPSARSTAQYERLRYTYMKPASLPNSSGSQAKLGALTFLQSRGA